jgi:hypothetical protein
MFGQNRYTDHLAGVIEVLLLNYPGQATARFLADLVYLFCRSLMHYEQVTPEEIMGFLVGCGFDSETTVGIADRLKTMAAVDGFARENNITTKEDKDILLALLGLKKCKGENE